LNSVKIPSWLWTVTRIFVSAVLIDWLVFHYDWNEVFAAVRNVPIMVIGLSMFVMLLSQAGTAWRLQALLAAQAIKMSYFFILRLNFTGLFAGNFLPSTIGGDALKFILLARYGAKKKAVFASLAVDRLISMASMMFFFPIAWSAAESFQLKANTGVLVLAAAIGLVMISAVGAGYFFYRKGVLQNPPPAWIKKVSQIIADVKTIAAAWAAQPIILLLAILISVCAILCSFLAGWLLLSWGLNIKIALLDWITVSVLVYFISLLPVSINGWGLQETGIVVLLSHYGALPEKALTYAVLIRILTMAVSLPGVFGIFGLNMKKQ
jgi:glycosyltransferase 2 family protein